MMENPDFKPWTNHLGCRVIVDYWTFGNESYSIILFPDNSLHLIWVDLKKEPKC